MAITEKVYIVHTSRTMCELFCGRPFLFVEPLYFQKTRRAPFHLCSRLQSLLFVSSLEFFFPGPPSFLLLSSKRFIIITSDDEKGAQNKYTVGRLKIDRKKNERTKERKNERKKERKKPVPHSSRNVIKKTR